jgi:hypothetical protein
MLDPKSMNWDEYYSTADLTELGIIRKGLESEIQLEEKGIPVRAKFKNGRGWSCYVRKTDAEKVLRAVTGIKMIRQARSSGNLGIGEEVLSRLDKLSRVVEKMASDLYGKGGTNQ